MDEGRVTRPQGLMSSLAAGRPLALVSPLIGSSSLNRNTRLTGATGASRVFKGLSCPFA